MPSTLTCPDETDLLALAMGEPVSAALTAHVAGCTRCQAKRDRLQAEVALLRDNRQKAPLSPSTLNEPMPHPADTSVQIDDLGATVTRNSSDRTGDPVSISLTDPGSDDAGSSSRDAPLPAAIGKYLVIGRFPRTGQAEVFRVVHPGLALELVLKLSLEPVRPDGRCEIIEEGKILAQLDHPNLVRVYDSDFLDDRPYLVMEYIRGRTLDQLAREGRLKPRRAAALLAKVAAATDYAHRHGIVHRDIKPKNILVDDSGEPRLIDFGMARLRHAHSDDPATPGGTFAFMPPEQARVELPEEQEKVGPRSDVFALGAVLYDLLTGAGPVPGPKLARIDGPRPPMRLRPQGPRRSQGPARPPGHLPQGHGRRSRRPIPLGRGVPEGAEPLCRSSQAPGTGRRRVGIGPPRRPGLRPDPVQAGPIPSQSQTVVIHHTSPAPGSLTGELIVRVRSKAGDVERELKVGVPDARPLLAGDHVHLEARLNQPAYVYFLWLDGQGHVSLLYPRDDGKFGSRPSGGSARETVHSPEALDEWHPMEGPGGLETVLLLRAARRCLRERTWPGWSARCHRRRSAPSWYSPRGAWTKASRSSRSGWTPNAGSPRKRTSSMSRCCN